MKKCPYCAEEIQDEAIVCKHCGRDLVPEKPAGRPARPAPKSIGQSSRTAAIVLTGLYAFNAFVTAPNEAELIGSLTVGLVATFFFWWGVCAIIVWIWRAIFKRS